MAPQAKRGSCGSPRYFSGVLPGVDKPTRCIRLFTVVFNPPVTPGGPASIECYEIRWFAFTPLAFGKAVVDVRSSPFADPRDTDFASPPRAGLDDGPRLAHVGEGLFLAG